MCGKPRSRARARRTVANGKPSGPRSLERSLHQTREARCQPPARGDGFVADHRDPDFPRACKPGRARKRRGNQTDFQPVKRVNAETSGKKEAVRAVCPVWTAISQTATVRE